MSEAVAAPHPRFWKGVFYVKGVWNCAFTAVCFFTEDALRDHLGVSRPDPTYRAMFLALAFIFGLGYWRVGQDITGNRDIVRGGALGQTAVFVTVAHAVLVARSLPALFIVPGAVDLIFAVLFAVFLLQTRKR
jgi:hypothetical protein